MKITVRCGTRNPEIVKVNLDDYGKSVPTDADDKTYETALDLLIETMNDETFADGGHRNDDAVNACIALHVMGYDACAWLENWCAAQPNKRFFRSDLDKFMGHVDRIAPYLSTWGPSGHESEALKKAIH